jgi:hypothetical protein
MAMVSRRQPACSPVADGIAEVDADNIADGIL